MLVFFRVRTAVASGVVRVHVVAVDLPTAVQQHPSALCYWSGRSPYPGRTSNAPH